MQHFIGPYLDADKISYSKFIPTKYQHVAFEVGRNAELKSNHYPRPCLHDLNLDNWHHEASILWKTPKNSLTNLPFIFPCPAILHKCFQDWINYLNFSDQSHVSWYFLANLTNEFMGALGYATLHVTRWDLSILYKLFFEILFLQQSWRWKLKKLR